LQFEFTSSVRIVEIILEIEFDIECFRRECSEVNMQFGVRRSIRNGKLKLEIELKLNVLEQSILK